MRTILVLYAVVLLAGSLAVAETEFQKIIIWEDNFKKCRKSNCLNGGINTDSWSFAIGDGSDEGIDITAAGLWGNQEEQCYFDTTDVAQILNDPDDASDGILAIRAINKKATISCPNKMPGQPSNARFKSARLHTRGKRHFVYDSQGSIFVEARIQLPDPGQGLWAAFWMLAEPTNVCGDGNLCRNEYGVWPGSGEIDIMEAINQMSATSSTIHVAGANELNINITKSTPLQNRGKWHIYGVEWGPGKLRFYRDKETVHELEATDWHTPFYSNATSGAPFDKEFYIILNIAVGGNHPGASSPRLDSGVMSVDWVRVYRQTDKLVTVKKPPVLNGGQIALIVIGGLLVMVLVAWIASAVWGSITAVTRAESFEKLRYRPA